MKWLKIFLGASVTALALWLSFRKVDIEALKTSLLQAKLLWVLLATTINIFIVYALGWRWQILLNPKEKKSLWSLFRLNIISQYVNILMPGRFGEIARAYLASRESQISVAFVMGTVAIEKIFDFFVFVALWISIPALFTLQKKVKGYRTALLLCFFAVCFLILLISRPKTFVKGASFLLRFFPRELRERVSNFIERSTEAFNLLKSTKTIFILIILTFGFIAGEILTNYFLFKAFDLNLTLGPALFVLLAIQVGNIPPSVPGKIGIFEYAVILALSVFNISKNEALSYGLMLHLVAFLPKIVLGFLFLSTFKIAKKTRA